ncbi:MAG: PfkB family carbohydrate kinase [Coriobacteriia bacterium]
MRGPVTVIGGANTDILGFVDEALIAADSNPGHVRLSAGGVGRNIAENLARLGVTTRFVTAFGEGYDALMLADECRAAGIDVRAVPAPGVPGSRYLAIMDAAGDLALAVNDMRALEAVTPAAVGLHADALDDAAVIVLDTNLPQVTLEYVAARWSGTPLMLDAVSVAKASRIAGVMNSLHTLKCNALEAAALAGTAGGDLEAAADALLAAGVPRVVITVGGGGALTARGTQRVRFVPPRVEVANATGAGDAFMAGLVFATLAGMDVTHSAAFSSAMAAIALTSERTVSESVSESTALDRMEAMLS